jgi:hypothetical protein
LPQKDSQERRNKSNKREKSHELIVLARLVNTRHDSRGSSAYRVSKDTTINNAEVIRIFGHLRDSGYVIDVEQGIGNVKDAESSATIGDLLTNDRRKSSRLYRPVRITDEGVENFREHAERRLPILRKWLSEVESGLSKCNHAQTLQGKVL